MGGRYKLPLSLRQKQSNPATVFPFLLVSAGFGFGMKNSSTIRLLSPIPNSISSIVGGDLLSPSAAMANKKAQAIN